MLSDLLVQSLLQTATRKKTSGLLAELSGLSPRYFRGARPGPKSASGRRRLIKRLREASIEHWLKLDYPEKMIRDWLSGFDFESSRTRPLEIFLRQCDGPNALFDLPATYRLAQEIDLISTQIDKARESGQAQCVKRALTELPDLQRFNRPSVIDEAHVSSDQYVEKVWRDDTKEAWNRYTIILVRNASLAFLAQLDKEYTAQYFPCWHPRHSFRFVLPSATETHEVNSSGKAKWDFRVPQRRLIDALACIAIALANDDLPAGAPSMSEFGHLAFDPETSGSPSKTLSAWRNSEYALTHRRLQELWETVNQSLGDLGKSRKNAPPWPLISAALYWQYVYVESSRRGVQSLWLIDDDYDYWLNQSHDSAHGDQVTEPWPYCFSCI